MSQSNEPGDENDKGGASDEFDFYFQFTKPLVLDLPTPEDKAIAAAWVQKLEAKPQTEEEKKVCLDYLKLLLFVLQRGRLSGIFKEQPPSGPLQPFPQGFSMSDMGNLMINEDELQTCGGGDARALPYTIELSNDLREFVAAQEIPNFGVQMYYAWSSDEPIHKWSVFDEEKFPLYILEKIKQLKESNSDQKISSKGCKKKCEAPLIEKYMKKKVKSPQEIEKSQGRSYHAYLGLVGQMGSGFKDNCDDDSDRYSRQDQRRPRCPKKTYQQPRVCAQNQGQFQADEMPPEEDFDNFMPGGGGYNPNPTKTCNCPHPYHLPGCEAHGKGPQYFEEPQSASTCVPNCRADIGPSWGGGARARNSPGTGLEPVPDIQQQPQMNCQRRSQSPCNRSTSRARGGEMSATDGLNKGPVCTCSTPPCVCPCPRAPSKDTCTRSARSNISSLKPGIPQSGVLNRGTQEYSGQREGTMGAKCPPPEVVHCYDPQYPDPALSQPMPQVQSESWCPREGMKTKMDDRQILKTGKPSRVTTEEEREEMELRNAWRIYRGNRPNRPSKQAPRQQAPPVQPQACPSSNIFQYPSPPIQRQPCPGGGTTFPGTPRPQPCPPPEGPQYSSTPNQPIRGRLKMEATSNYRCNARQSSPRPETRQNYCPQQPPRPTTPPFSPAPPPNSPIEGPSGLAPRLQQKFRNRGAPPSCFPCSQKPPVAEFDNCDGMMGNEFLPSGEKTYESTNYTSLMKPKNQNYPCSPFAVPPDSPGCFSNMANIIEGIKQKTEAHREKCSAPGRRAHLNDPGSGSRNMPQSQMAPCQSNRIEPGPSRGMPRAIAGSSRQSPKDVIGNVPPECCPTPEMTNQNYCEADSTLKGFDFPSSFQDTFYYRLPNVSGARECRMYQNIDDSLMPTSSTEEVDACLEEEEEDNCETLSDSGGECLQDNSSVEWLEMRNASSGMCGQTDAIKTGFSPLQKPTNVAATSDSKRKDQIICSTPVRKNGSVPSMSIDLSPIYGVDDEQPVSPGKVMEQLVQRNLQQPVGPNAKNYLEKLNEGDVPAFLAELCIQFHQAQQDPMYTANRGTSSRNTGNSSARKRRQLMPQSNQNDCYPERQFQ